MEAVVISILVALFVSDDSFLGNALDSLKRARIYRIED